MNFKKLKSIEKYLIKKYGEGFYFKCTIKEYCKYLQLRNKEQRCSVCGR